MDTLESKVFIRKIMIEGNERTLEIYKALINQISFSDSFKEWLVTGERFYISRDRDYEKYIAIKKFSNALHMGRSR